MGREREGEEGQGDGKEKVSWKRKNGQEEREGLKMEGKEQKGRIWRK